MARKENFSIGSLQMTGLAADASFSRAAAGAGAQVVSIQLKSADGADLAEKTCVLVYMSNSSSGDGIDGECDTLTGGTDGSTISLVAGKVALCQSESDGDIDVSVADSTSGAASYMVVVLPSGKRVVSAAITPTP